MLGEQHSAFIPSNASYCDELSDAEELSRRTGIFSFVRAPSGKLSMRGGGQSGQELTEAHSGVDGHRVGGVKMQLTVWGFDTSILFSVSGVMRSTSEEGSMLPRPAEAWSKSFSLKTLLGCTMFGVVPGMRLGE
jgi:hypothetical protein